MIQNKVGLLGYTYLVSERESGVIREQFFCENSDCYFQVNDPVSNRYGWTDCEKIVNDTSIIINGKNYPNIQVIRKVLINGKPYGFYGYKNIYLYYFAKDIGIIKCERAIDYVNRVYETEYEIVKYEIKK